MSDSFSLLAKSLFDFNHVPMATWFDKEDLAWQMLKVMSQKLPSLQNNQILSPIPDGVTLIHPESIHIEEDCIIEPGCSIQGPCYIGKGTQIRHGAYLRGYVLTGKNCVIGHTTEVKNAIFCDEAKAGHFAYIGDTILGHDVNLGAGTKCANLRFDHQELAIRWQSQVYKTSMRKFGAIVGDRCQLGCNSVTSPGTLLGPDSWVWPLVLVTGVHPCKSRITQTVAPSAH